MNSWESENDDSIAVSNASLGKSVLKQIEDTNRISSSDVEDFRSVQSEFRGIN